MISDVLSAAYSRLTDLAVSGSTLPTNQLGCPRFFRHANRLTTLLLSRRLILVLLVSGLSLLTVVVGGKIAYSDFSERQSMRPRVIASTSARNEATTSKSNPQRDALAAHHDLFSPLAESAALTGPILPQNLPFGVNLVSGDPGNTGLIGRTSGNTWYFSNINLPLACPGDTTYWGPQNNLVRLSFLNSSFANTPGEVLTFSPALSNLPGGIAVWTGFTINPTSGQTVFTRFTMTANLHSGGVPGIAGGAIALVDPTTVGLSSNVGGLVPVTPGIDYQINMRFDASFSSGGGFQPALDFYDANTTAGGTAYESFTAGFYYYNSVPTISHIGNQITDMNVAAGPISFSVGDCETSPAALVVSATSSNTTLVPNANIAFGGGGSVRNITLTPATGETGTTTVTYSVFDGIDTTSDSFVLTVNPPPTLGTYSDTSVALGANATVTPGAAPTDTTSINVSSSTNFKGTFSADPATGVVRVTNAHPAGTHTVTVTAFNGSVLNTTKTFALTVQTGTECTGASLFTNAADPSVGSLPQSIAIGDFNSDGKQDFAIANYNSGTVSIRLGDGLGAFSGTTSVSVGANPRSVAIGDFNNDGEQDIAAASFGTNTVSIRLGDGAGGFSGTTEVSVGTQPFSVAIGDFNNDGKQDIAAANANSSSNSVSIRLGDGSGGFSGTTNVSVGSNPCSVAIGDFNDDGKQDIAVANLGTDTVSIRLGDGLGGFTGTTNVGVGTDPDSVAIGDFNNDGKQDIAVANSISNTISIRFGDGFGGFTGTTEVSVTTPSSVAIGDFNNDGKQDIAGSSGSNTVSIRLGDGAGGFSGTTEVSVGTQPRSVTIGDFNGDGKQDFAVANQNSNTVSVRLGACNLPPTISDVPNQLVQRNQAFSSTLNIGDTEDPVSALTIAGTSNNQTLIPNANVVISGSGATRTVTVTPANNQVGTATITLTVTDTNGATASDTFDVRVNAVPLLTNAGLTLNQGATATITNSLLSVSDADNTAAQLLYTIGPGGSGGPPHQGTLKLNSAPLSSGSFFTQDDINNNRLTYTHDDSNNTTDDFQFNVTDGDGATLPNDGVHNAFTFSISITLINHAPVAVDGNGTTGLGAPFDGTFAATDRDLPAQTLTRRIVTNGTKGVAVLNDATTGAFTYTPNAGQTGQDTIIFQVNDGWLDSVNPGTFTIDIQNQPPAAQNGSGNTTEGVALNGTLGGTDPDMPPQTLTFTIAGNPTKGNVNINDTATGAFTYTPNANAFGADSFTFTVGDGLLTSSPATFSINVHPNLDAGDIFVTNSASTINGQVGSVIQIDPSNGMQALVTSGGNLTNPSAIVIEHDGKLVVINGNNNVFTLVRIDPATGTQSLIPSGPAFANPVGLGIGPGADLFVADPFAHCVFEVNPTTGAQVHVFSGGDLGAPAGLAFDSTGNLLVSDAAGLFGGASKIIRINTATDAQAVVSSGGDLLLPIDIDLDSNGDIIVSDAPNIFGPGAGKLIRVNPTTGAQILITGAGLGKPSGVAANRTNHDSYTPDNSGPSVLKTTSVGATATLATGEYLTLPNGIAMTRCEPNDAPVAAAGGPYTADLGSGFTLNGSGSSDPDSACGDSIASYSWDIDSGALSFSGATPSLTAAQISALGVGSHNVSLTVTDALGLTAADSTTLTIYDNRPFASFNANPNPAACEQSVLFSSTSTHGRPDRSIVSYQWDFGDSTTGLGANVSHTFTHFGVYTVTLTVTDNNIPAKTDTVSTSVSISQGNLAPVAVDGGPYTADLGSSLSLNGTGSSDPNASCGDSIVSYSWVIGGTINLSGAAPSLSAAQINSLGVGSHSVVLTVTDTFAVTGTDSTTLNIYDNTPVAAFTANPNPAACNQSISFDASTSSHGRPDRSLVSYQWDFGDGQTGAGVIASHAYAAYGNFTATLTVTDNNLPAKTATTSTTVTVSQGNQPPVSVPGGPYTTTVGSGVSLDGTGSNDPNAGCGDSIVQYSWSIDAGAVTTTGSNPTLTWAQLSVLGVGSHTVSLAVTDTFGATGSGATTLTINPPPPTLGTYPDTSVALSADAIVTPGAVPTNTTSINVSSSTNFKGTFSANSTTGVVTVTNAHPAGIYTVTVTAFNGSVVNTTRTFTLTVQTGTACAGASIFTNAGDLSVGPGSRSVAIGDFNGDGKQDFAFIANGGVLIRLGDGTGGFTGTTNFSAGTQAWSVAIGDFNNDGKQDIAVADIYSNIVAIRLGDGAGGFSGTTDVSVGSGPASVAIGDFNEDGKQDIAVANLYSNTVSIRLGDGSGGFSGTTNVSVGSYPRSVAIGDFNNDGNQDIAVANENSNTVSIRLGDGLGGFTGTTNVSVDSSPLSVAIGDFNNDGRQDIATANSGTVSIRLGDGLGGFTGATNVSVGLHAQSVAIGDFNNDGRQDFAAANELPSATVSIRLGDGLGGFTGTTNVSVGAYPYSVAIGDFNGDGKQDFAATSWGSNTVSIRLGQCNLPPTITATTGVIRGQGEAPMNEMIASVDDAESGANGVTVTVNGGSSATVNGITVTNIVNNGGPVEADISADCTATNASFTLTASDGQGGTATDTLTITVVPNTPPFLTYNSPQKVTEGNSLTIAPTTVGDFGGGLASIIVQSPGTYTGTISVDNSTGVVSISNDAPAGSHTITIRATDNCGVFTDATFTLNVNAATCTSPPAGMIAWWPGDGNANDIVGGNNGTLQNGAAYAPGKVGQAFSFDGVNDYVDIPNVVSLWPEGTLDTWVNFNDPTPKPSGDYIFSAGNGTNLGIHASEGPELRFGIYAAGWHWVNSGVVPNAGQWYHVAATWGPAGIEIYIDGVLRGTNPYTGPSYNSSYNRIGASEVTNSTVNALVDEFEIFNRALSQSEIQSIYNTSSAGKCKPAATLGNYANTSVNLSDNATIAPDSPPTNAMSINVSTSTSFNGKLEADPATGVVRVTNAHPAGAYTVTVKGFGPGGSTTKTFTLTVLTGTACAGASIFTIAADASVGGNPRSVAIGDFNNDGKQDVAVANNGSATISIRLGDGAGGFSGTTNVSVGSGPGSVAIGDFNNDGKQDIAVANSDSTTVSTRLGDGLGGFSGTTNISVGGVPVSVAIGDLNNDGKQDIAVANQLSATVSIRVGDGSGGFSGTTEVGVGAAPFSVAIGDFNNDGRHDFVAANAGSNTVSIRLGDGSGGFSGTTNVSVGASPYSVAIGDFNNDSQQDIAVANNNSTTVSIRLGDGTGGFTVATEVSVGDNPSSVAIGDFNNDGKMDIAAANKNSSTVSIRLGNGDGTFTGTTNVSVGSIPYSVAIGDFNGDGKQDFAAANTSSNTVSIRLGACNLPPTIAATTGLSQQQVSPVSNSKIATVTDDGGNGSVAVTVNGGANSTVNGVSVSNITNTGGNITADIVANCTASNATFTLQASDGSSTATDTLSVTVTVNTTPTLTYASPQSVAFAGALNVTPMTASDNGTIAGYAVQAGHGLTTAPAVDSSGVVSITNAQPAGTHTVTIRATDNCGSTTDAVFTLTVSKANQTITVGTHAPASATYNASFTVAATSNSGLAVAYSSAGACTNAGAVFTMNSGTGTCTVRYDQAGDTNYNPAPQVTEAVAAQKASQTITVNTHAPANASYNTNFTVAATSNSGLPVAYTSSGVCTNVGATFTMTSGTGTCTVMYNQAGDDHYNSASQVTESVTAQNANQSITFGGLSGKTFGDPDFNVSATATSNLAVSFTASGQCTVTGTSVHLAGAGSCTITAKQGGDSNYNAAPDVLQLFNVAKAATATAVASSVNPSELGQSLTFTATVTSGVGTPTGTVQFKDGVTDIGSPQTLNGSGVAQLTTSSLTAGPHTITADYSGDANFLISTGTLSGGQTVKSQPSLSINDVTMAEGNSGTTSFVFTVTLSAASNLTVNVNYAAANGTATLADSDYQAASGTVTFNPGDLTKTVTVLVNGDQKFEADETFVVNVSNAVNAAISDNQGLGTILNDDSLQLILDESGPDANQAAAVESIVFTRDPFRVRSIAEWLNLGTDQNTRVIIFAANLQLNPGETASAVEVNLVGSNNQMYNVAAEDVRVVPNSGFAQVTFRLPDSLVSGACTVTVKAHSQISNSAFIRIGP